LERAGDHRQAGNTQPIRKRSSTSREQLREARSPRGWKAGLRCEKVAPGVRRRAPGRGGGLDRFSFFFAFYGLILGLAATELLSGFAGFVRARALKSIEAQTALLGLFTFLAICATWIDAWDSLQGVSLDFAGLWAPILIATCYYLAATVIFPRDPAEFGRLALYFAERKQFVVAMLLAAEVLVSATFLGVFARELQQRPAVFWLYDLPYNLTIKASFVALLFVRARRANIVLLVFLILLFLIPYWEHGTLSGWIHRHFD
jgi:hypothetical protein